MMTNKIYSQRLILTQSRLADNTGLLVSDPVHIEYLTGYQTLTADEREAFLVIPSGKSLPPTLILSSFSPYSSPPSSLQVKRGQIRAALTETFKSLAANNYHQLFIDPETLTLFEYRIINQLSPAMQISLKLVDQESDIIDQIRMIKDPKEIKLLSQANQLTHQALNQTFADLQSGMTELEVAQVFEDYARRLGAKAFSFPTIVAFGPHSALPHHQPTTTKLNDNTAVLIDVGVRHRRYCGDVTRTRWFGKNPDPEFVKIETIVKDAYQAVCDVILKMSFWSKAIESVQDQKIHSPNLSFRPKSRLAGRSGEIPASGELITVAELDTAARDLITQAGYGDQFIHTTGHGVGLSVHEYPSVNSRNDIPVQPGMVITNEPGIYLEGKFGYRFENTIAITKKSCNELL